MRIIEAQKLEDCFDGSRVYRYQFAEPWTEGRVRCLGAHGALEYFTDFPRPFFRLRTPTGLQVTGVGAERSCRVVYPRTNQGRLKRELETWLASTEDPLEPRNGDPIHGTKTDEALRVR